MLRFTVANGVSESLLTAYKCAKDKKGIDILELSNHLNEEQFSEYINYVYLKVDEALRQKILLFKLVQHLIASSGNDQQEQGRMTRLDGIAHLFDEFVINADVTEMAA